MISKRVKTQSSCHIDYTCLKFAAGLKTPLGDEVKAGQPVLFLFMCRWTCSRCWKVAMILGRLAGRLAAHNVAAVLVGDSHNIQPATRLAAELKLPFTLLGDDASALRCAYGLLSAEGGPSLLLLNAQGKRLFCSEILNNHLALDYSGLITAIEQLSESGLEAEKKAAC